MKRISLIITVLTFLAFSASAGAVTLVTPQGQPVGGKWQRWADQARVPTYSGTVIFGDVADCEGAAHGCALFTLTPAEIVVADHPIPRWKLANPRWVLYHELGHIYDWQHLTAADRAQLTLLMGDRSRSWTEVRVVNGGAQDDFADLYAFCAENYGRRGWLSANVVSWPTAIPFDHLVPACRTIVRVSSQVGTLPPDGGA